MNTEKVTIDHNAELDEIESFFETFEGDEAVLRYDSSYGGVVEMDVTIANAELAGATLYVGDDDHRIVKFNRVEKSLGDSVRKVGCGWEVVAEVEVEDDELVADGGSPRNVEGIERGEVITVVYRNVNNGGKPDSKTVTVNEDSSYGNLMRMSDDSGGHYQMEFDSNHNVRVLKKRNLSGHTSRLGFIERVEVVRSDGGKTVDSRLPVPDEDERYCQRPYPDLSKQGNPGWEEMHVEIVRTDIEGVRHIKVIGLGQIGHFMDNGGDVLTEPTRYTRTHRDDDWLTAAMTAVNAYLTQKERIGQGHAWVVGGYLFFNYRAAIESMGGDDEIRIVSWE